jgi:hypothetical protein
MVIDCDTCVMRDVACGGCVVSFLTIAPTEVESAPAPALVRTELTPAEDRALTVLAESGLVPPLRLAHRTG